MVLNPLTEVGVGMLMAILVGRRQFVVHFQRNGKGRQGEEHAAQCQRQRSAQHPMAELPGAHRSHRA